MKRLFYTTICSILFLAFFNNESKAQIQFGLDVGPNIPFGDFSDFAETGPGAKLIFKYFVDDNFAVMANIGYHSFDSDLGLDFQIIPVNVNVEYYFNLDKIKPYISVGPGFYSISIENDNRFFDTSEYQDTEFGVNLGGGIAYPIKDNIDLTGDFKLHFLDNTSFMTLNFGVLFGL